MTRYFLFIVSITFSVTMMYGQSGRPSQPGVDVLYQLQDDKLADQVKLELDSLLVDNYYKFRISNMQVLGVPGYRIRIYSESGLGAKEEQQRVRAKFLSLFPGFDAYHRYDEPFFKVYVGDCRTRSEVLKLYDMVKKEFPNPFIVEDYINLKSGQ